MGQIARISRRSHSLVKLAGVIGRLVSEVQGQTRPTAPSLRPRSLRRESH